MDSPSDDARGQRRSMLGPQASSAHISSPAFGFGSSTRDVANKVFVSREHSKVAPTSTSPGPARYSARSSVGPQPVMESSPTWVFASGGRLVDAPRKDAPPGPGTYEPHSSIGPQANGLLPTMPAFGMGTGTRRSVEKVFVSHEHAVSQFSGYASPGPAAPYSLPTAVGRQGSSLKANQPTWVFSASKRFQDPDIARALKLPAPNAYNAASGLGTQYASTKRTAPLAGFGTSTRVHAAKVFSNPAAEKTKSYGKASPGPCAYLPPIEARVRNAPSYGFGTCDRFFRHKQALRIADIPGPAAYNL